MIKKIEYTSLNPGKTILFFGAIHGNETCGPQALTEVMQEIDQGDIILNNGKIIFVPVCNPLAFGQGKRFVDVNLNRIFKKHEEPVLYEEKIANILCDYFDGVDILVDIHSIHSDGKPFAFQDYADPGEREFMKILGVENIVTGWLEMYTNTPDSGTVEYGHSKGTMGTVIECGNHNNPESIQVAKKAILNTLKYFGITEGKAEVTKNIQITEAQYFVKKTKPGKLIKDWQHLDPVKHGEIIALYDDGEKLFAEEDGFILLPFSDASIGAEWFYFGKTGM